MSKQLTLVALLLILIGVVVWWAESSARTAASPRSLAQPRAAATARSATSEIVYAEDGTPILNESDDGSQTDYMLAENARQGAN